MSDLQIGLAILGVLVVAAVVAFNWWQEKKFHERAERSFHRPDADVLLRPGLESAARRTSAQVEPQRTAGAPGAEVPRPEPARAEAARIESARIEPKWHEAPAAAPAAPAGGKTAQASTAVPAPDPSLDYIAEIRAGEVIPPSMLAEAAASLRRAAKPVVLTGFDYQARHWQPFEDGDHAFTSLQACLQLTDRDGPVDREQLQNFQSAVRQYAGRIGAIADLPDPDAALTRAQELHQFCSNVDVAIGINVIAHSGQVFHGTQIRALAEAQGMKLQPGGGFALYDVEGGTLFSLDNQDSASFRADQMRQVTTAGITFLLDVPRTRNGMATFERMVAMSRQFAESLDGLLADDNRQLLSDSGLDKIRQQLRTIYGAMEARGVPSGSPGALRLFA
jgi:FtsZ-interacting cell division protein ZipA